jgi:hypothetical protein
MTRRRWTVEEIEREFAGKRVRIPAWTLIYSESGDRRIATKSQRTRFVTVRLCSAKQRYREYWVGWTHHGREYWVALEYVSLVEARETKLIFLPRGRVSPLAERAT